MPIRRVIAMLTSLALLSLPVHGAAQQEDEDESGNSIDQSLEESTADSTEATTEETSDPTSEPFRDVTDVTSSREEADSQQTPAERRRETDRERLIIAGLAGLVIVLAVVAIASWSRPKAATASADDRRALDYLRANDARIRVDLARGDGPTVDDLAASYLLPPERRARFGRALHARRVELIELLDPHAQAEPAHARAFLRKVGEIMADDPELRGDFERWRMVLGVAQPPADPSPSAMPPASPPG